MIWQGQQGTSGQVGTQIPNPKGADTHKTSFGHDLGYPTSAIWPEPEQWWSDTQLKKLGLWGCCLRP